MMFAIMFDPYLKLGYGDNLKVMETIATTK
jgi:hypothetical protein